MQTKNVNVQSPSTVSKNEKNAAVAAMTSNGSLMNGGHRMNGTGGGGGGGPAGEGGTNPSSSPYQPLPVTSSTYLQMGSPYLPVPVSSSAKNQSPYQHLPSVTSPAYQPMNGGQNLTSSVYQPMNGGQIMTSSASLPYQPPPLPPRVGPRHKESPMPPGNVVSVYKPVPPPKPFSGSPVSNNNNNNNSNSNSSSSGGSGGSSESQQDSRRQEQQETAASLREQLASVAGSTLQTGLPPLLPHILVTDQGHFHTHSAKFPIETKEAPGTTFSNATSHSSWHPPPPRPPPGPALISGSSTLGRGLRGVSGLAGMGMAKGSTLPRSTTAPTTHARPSVATHATNGVGGGGGGGGERDHLLSTERHIRFSDGIDNPGLVDEHTHMQSYRTQGGGGNGGGGGGGGGGNMANGGGAPRPPSGIPPEGTLAGVLPSQAQQRPFDSPFLSRPYRTSTHQYHPPTSQHLPGPSHLPPVSSHGLVSSQYHPPGTQHLPLSSAQVGAFNRETWTRNSQGQLAGLVELHPPQGHIHLNGHAPQHHHTPTSAPTFPHNGVAHHHHAHPHAHPQPNNHVEGAHTHPAPQHSHAGEGADDESSERREEARKEDKWGSLTRGLAARKYQNFKEKLSNKFSKSEKPEDRPGSQGEAQGRNGTSSQGSSTQEGSSVPSSSAPGARQELGGQPAAAALDGGRAAKLNTSFRKAMHQSSGKEAMAGEAALNGPQEQNSGGGQQVSGGVGGGLPPHYPRPAASRPPAALPPQSSPPLGRPPEHMGRGLANRRSGSYHHLAHLRQEAPTWRPHHYSADNLAEGHALPSDHTYSGPAAGAGRGQPAGGEGSGGSGGGSDSGRGTAGSGGEGRPVNALDTSLDSAASQRHAGQGHSSGNDSEWVDVTDTELQRIMKLGAEGKGGGRNGGGGGVAGRESLAATPPLPPLSPEGSPASSPARHRKHSLSYSTSGLNKPDLLEAAGRRRGGPGGQESTQSTPRREGGSQGTHGHGSSKVSSGGGSGGAHKGSVPPMGVGWPHRKEDVRQRSASFDSHRHKNRINLDPGVGDLEAGEMTSTTDALDLDSMLDGATEATTDDEALSAYDPDVHLIRKQLEGLEGMYSEVLKLLGGGGRRGGRALLGGGGDLKTSRRRMHGSLSSLPSSVMSSRPGKDRRKVIDDRVRRTARDSGSKNIHKRFQRLESHVVTLARSVAHLSSEMRTQHLMFQEIESVRAEVAALRNGGGGGSGGGGVAGGGGGFPAKVGGHVSWESFRAGIPGLSNPGRVKKLTQFFGDEPPLVRIFLRKLGYEKYAPLFEQEKIGMLELPYLTEERLHKIGIPMGPRLRILQEAQGPIRKEGNLSVYVV
ncbi:collagen alpha-2(I) chain-like isoform X2 [Eriocheir sinensis]|uniref:collagen alpha-2(I) chain-like isoform X2 n=1 Tax=Eriocheir sinensis TaxID=95602 RepID=UPI0021C7C069|nr:collagen alpha-2(I) chain-like isoform X2 [Eriocheir sinensis]